ncbi:MAG: IPT/TIG domain-containing protein [Flavobacteriaceae bacterium]
MSGGNRMVMGRIDFLSPMVLIKGARRNPSPIFMVLGLLLSNCSSTEQSSREETPNPVHTIGSIEPDSGFEGSDVTITGAHFGADTGNIGVRFNGTPATEISFASEKQISTKVPKGATTGPVRVTVRSVAVESSFDFKVLETPKAPTLSEISPTEGLVGTILTITGDNFGREASRILIKFNGIEAREITQITPTEIKVVVPNGASSGPISVLKMGTEAIMGANFRVMTPENFKIAFLGDSHIGEAADAVLQLIKQEGTHAVVHPGDLNYAEVPKDFEDNIDGILGPDFPYFYGVGNHDDTVWNGAQGYQSYLEARFRRLGLPWKGQLGVLSSFSFQGIFFVTSAPDEFGIGTKQAGEHIANELKGSNAIWNISLWHKNQHLMQIGGKRDEAGWDVYEASRRGGAIVATAHEHSYCRTFEMADFQTQIISSTETTVQLQRDNPSTEQMDEGRSFAFVSGLGGKSIRDAEDGLENNPWWADVYHSGNGAQYGALFGEFNYNGDVTLARFYFKDIDGVVRDVFFVRSHN